MSRHLGFLPKKQLYKVSSKLSIFHPCNNCVVSKDHTVLYGTALKHTGRLQRVQHALARVMVNQRSRTPFSSNELLKQLHWLPLDWRIQLKLATLTFKALYTGRPPYLTDLLQHHQSTRSLRSSSSHQLFNLRHNLPFGSRAFRFSAPWILNKLPLHICETQSLPAFKCHLKTHFF